MNDALIFHAHLLNTIEQSVIVTDLDGIVIYWNRFAEHLYGWSAAEAVGRNIMELVSPELSSRQAEEIMAQLRQGKSWTGEFMAQRKDDTLFPIQTVNSPIYDDKETLIGIVGISHDITERKGTEKALRESENKYRTLVGQASDGIHTYDLKGNFLEVNSKLCEMLGYTAEELLRLNVKDLIPAEDLAADPIRFKELRAGNTLLRERWLIRKDGTLFPAEISGTMIKDGVLQAIIRDVTQRKRAEEALRNRENQLRLITDAIPLLISYVDKEHRYRFVNRSYTEWFGKSREEVLDKHLSEVLGEAAYQSLLPEVETALSGEEVIFERLVPYKSGERFIRVNYIPEFDLLTGAVKGFHAFVQDISESKRDEGELRRSHEELEARVRERTVDLQKANDALQAEILERRQAEEARIEVLHQLVNAQEEERRRIARDLHDQLGQQLTVLRLNLDLLKKMCRDAEMFQQISEVQKVARRIDADVDFLAWEMRPSALDDLGIAAALDNYVRQWSRHFEIPVEFNADRFGKITLAPEAETNLYRITQEALNNVSKHAKAGGVNVLLEPRGDSLVLIIEDDGIGFEPSKHTLKEKGVSLGLIGMQERAALVGGTLEIESAEGKGATIYAKVPILSFGKGEKE